MLYIVLVLVLAALGLLVTALITASSLWAWVSIGLSVLAGLILIVDWLRRRRRAAAAEASEPEAAAPAAEPAPEPVDEEQTTLIPAAGELGDPADTPEPDLPAEPESPAETTVVVAAAEPETEPVPAAGPDPGVEPTSPADIATVSELDDEVVVVDEYPRYHLTDCGWLAGRVTIPIGVGEARQLGFTPCVRCTPDAALVAHARSRSKADN